MRRLLPLLLIASTFPATACRGPDLEDPAEVRIAEQLVDDTVELANTRADMLCSCGSSYGFTSRDECREYFDYLDEEEHECLVDVFLEDPVASRAFLECTTGFADELVECLEPMSCGHGGLIDACHDAFREGIAECPELPVSVLVELRSCTG